MKQNHKAFIQKYVMNSNAKPGYERLLAFIKSNGRAPKPRIDHVALVEGHSLIIGQKIKGVIRKSNMRIFNMITFMVVSILLMANDLVEEGFMLYSLVAINIVVFFSVVYALVNHYVNYRMLSGAQDFTEIATLIKTQKAFVHTEQTES